VSSTSGGAALWTVTAVRFGTRTAQRSKVYLNYQIYKQPDGDIPMDYFFWILSNGTNTVLVDTGFNAISGGKRSRSMLITPAEALEALNIDGDAIDQVIISHLHYDHAGNLDLAPAATFAMARKEFDFWTGAYGARGLFASAVEQTDIEGVRSLLEQGRLILTDGDVELRPGIRLIEVGGHTPGELIVVVDTAHGEVILASDAIHYYEELDDDRPFVELSDLVDVYSCFDTVRELVSAGGILVPGHDPAVMDRFPPVAGVPQGLAVMITAPLASRTE
jgi:glyoxylase-like metal-dependent hydrolase (beta-lactamase superfamily II)